MRTLFLLISFLTSSILFGRTDVQTDSVSLPSSGSVSRLPSIMGSRFATMGQTGFYVQSASGLVKLSYPGYAAAAPLPTGTGTVKVAVSYQAWDNTQLQMVSSTTNVTLTLNFQNGSFSQASYIRIPNAQKISITSIISVNIPSGWPALTLGVSVITNSFDQLSKNTLTLLGSSFSLSAVATPDSNLVISWPSVTGADSYDLEWTYVSNQDSTLKNPQGGSVPDYNNILAPSNIPVDPYLFRYNSTRVNVSGVSYAIPLIYEQGIIIYRIRAVGNTVVNNQVVPIQTDWTAQDGANTTVAQYAPNYYTHNGHEQLLNWQYSLSLAEQGKNKTVLSYYDGSSRSRQAVTRINSDKRVVVGETLYDYNGRPVIQILPVPVSGNTLSYYPNFNLINGESQLSKSDYDAAQKGNGCNYIVPTFSTQTGASQYYSPLNPFDTAGNSGSHLLNRNLIPNAQQYPFTQTLYTPDNTGRVAAQSGVGSTHILGSNKETRYAYGSPQQPELSRLFGNQVGYAAHYKKNAVVDANGQTSVSYMDMEGKVVATALAGDNPSNLDTLGDNAARSVTTDLIASSGDIANQIGKNGFTRTYTTNFLVTGANTKYNFNYQGKVGSYTILCDNPSASSNASTPIDGVVDVQLTLNDKCGNNVFNDLKNTQAGNSGSTQTISISEQQTLQPGEYQLTKTLTIDDAQLEVYWSNYLNSNNCLLTSDYFVNAELAQIDVSGCGMTCATCEHKRDSVLNSSNNLTSDQKTLLAGLCTDLCDDVDITCLSSLQAMQGDLSPDGQYGQVRLMSSSLTLPAQPSVSIDPNTVPSTTSNTDISINNSQNSSNANNNNTIDPTQFPLSVFNDNNNLRVDPVLLQSVTSAASWHYPIQVSNTSVFTAANEMNEILASGVSLAGATYSITDYKNSDGSIFYANIIVSYDNNNNMITTPAVMSNVTLYNGAGPVPTSGPYLIPVNQASNIYKVPVRFLKNYSDMDPYWQQGWSSYLVPYHPEYQYYVQCTAQQQNNDFDYLLNGTTNLQDAISAGFIDATSGQPLLLSTCKDTYICSNPVLLGYMKYMDANYKTMVIGGINQTLTMAQTATVIVNCPRLQSNCGLSTCTDGIINTDAEWNIFKGLYTAQKQLLLTNQADQKAVNGLYYNGCIGHSDYLTSPDDYYFLQPSTVTVPVSYSYSKCFLGHFCTHHTAVMYQKATVYPYLNPGQVCYIDKAPLYKDKVQRFYATFASGTPGANPPKNCTVVTPSADGSSGITMSVPCDSDLQAALNQATNAAYSAKYSSCGECPMGTDVEQFIMDLRSNNVLVTAGTSLPGGNLLLSCTLPQYPVQMGDVLSVLELSQANAASPVVNWNSSVTPVSSGSVLTGIISNNGGLNQFDTISLWMPSSVTVPFSKLTQLCCLNVNTTGVTSYFPYKPGKVFTLQGYYVDNLLVQHTVTVEGTTDIPLAPCTFAPNCLLSDDASNVAAFLNTLALNNTAQDPDKQQNLISPSALDLSSSSIIGYYNGSVTNLLHKNNLSIPGEYVDDITSLSPSWQSTVSNDTLSGVLTTTFIDSTVQISPGVYQSDLVNTVIEISGLPSGYTYSNVTMFRNLRVGTVSSTDICTSQPCQRTTFYADALVNTGTPGAAPVIVPVQIYVPGLQPVVCTPVLPGAAGSN